MKKILIVNNNMHIGGIQKSLLNLLTALTQYRGAEYEIDLLLFAKRGALLDEIPKQVSVSEGNFFTKIMGLTQAEAGEEGVLTCLNRSFWTVVTRLFTTRISFGILSGMQPIKKTYDAAISFMQPGTERVFYGGCPEYVLRAVKAKKKICFIHCDFMHYGGNTSNHRALLSRFDALAAVSDSVKARLIEAAPELAGKAKTVHNCCAASKIKAAAEEYAADAAPDRINLFTAARLHAEKGILRMLPILSQIKRAGIAFIWRIAGDGPDKKEIAERVTQYGLSRDVILLGNLKNPYPYFKAADLVLVPSYHEAAPMVFDEARVLGTPVFTTDTTSAIEMIADKKCGIVCKNDDREIEKALTDYLSTFQKQKNAAADLDFRAPLQEFDDLITG